MYNHRTVGDSAVPNCPQSASSEYLLILRGDVENAFRTLRKRKSAGEYNIPAELDQTGVIPP